MATPRALLLRQQPGRLLLHQHHNLPLRCATPVTIGLQHQQNQHQHQQQQRAASSWGNWFSGRRGPKEKATEHATEKDAEVDAGAEGKQLSVEEAALPSLENGKEKGAAATSETPKGAIASELQRLVQDPGRESRPPPFWKGVTPIKQIPKKKMHPPIPVPRPPPSALDKCKDPIATITARQLAVLDPTGARTRLFDRTNPEAAHVGDILMVRLRTGEPFAGVCINIRKRGVDTAILLRGQLTRVGVECWFKVYSPNVEGIEVVQRATKRPRRARLYYLRQPRHDIGSVEGVVQAYLRRRAMLGANEQSRAAREANKAVGRKAERRL